MLLLRATHSSKLEHLIKQAVCFQLIPVNIDRILLLSRDLEWIQKQFAETGLFDDKNEIKQVSRSNDK